MPQVRVDTHDPNHREGGRDRRGKPAQGNEKQPRNSSKSEELKPSVHVIPISLLSLIDDDDQKEPPVTPPPPTIILSLNSLKEAAEKLPPLEDIKEHEKEVKAEDKGNQDDWEHEWSDDKLQSLSPASPTSTSPTSSSSNSSSSTSPSNSSSIPRGRGACKFNSKSLSVEGEKEDREDTGKHEYNESHSRRSNHDNEYSDSHSRRSNYDNNEVIDDERLPSHIVEIYNIPSTATTPDVEQFLELYHGVVRIKWVNDTTALAIFRSPVFARNSLSSLSHSVMKVRPLNESPPEIKSKATSLSSSPSSSSSSIPPASASPRPYKTTTTVARRLIANALQIPSKDRTLEKPNHEDDIAALHEARRSIWND